MLGKPITLSLPTRVEVELYCDKKTKCTTVKSSQIGSTEEKKRLEELDYELPISATNGISGNNKVMNKILEEWQ